MYYTYFFCLDTSQQNDCVELKFCQIIDTVRETASVRANFLSILQEIPIFSILHIHFYKTLTSVCLIYYLFYLNNHISLIFIISNKQIPTWPHPYFSFFFSCQPSFFFSEPSQGSFSAFPSSFYSLFFFLFFFFFFSSIDFSNSMVEVGARVILWFCCEKKLEGKSKMKGA